VYYVDKLYERIDWSSAVSEEKTYIGPSVVVYQQGSTRDVRYLHHDRLGSLDSVTNPSGAEVVADSHGFDAFGKPRARDWQWSGAKLHPDTDYQKTTEHGFTGHEHLDETLLIHMNGRVYDYQLGRFLSVDPIISNPANSQSINPYSYIGNNPLSGVDPTGYCPEGSTAATGSHICQPMSTSDKVGAAISSGAATAKTAIEGPREQSQVKRGGRYESSQGKFLGVQSDVGVERRPRPGGEYLRRARL
jgi:RHS repeat-associated protein